MDFKTYDRRPFQVEAVEVTEENFDEIAALVGRGVKTNNEGVRYIVVDRKIIPNGYRIYTGWFVTLLDENYRAYNPAAFGKQFDVPDEASVTNES